MSLHDKISGENQGIVVASTTPGGVWLVDRVNLVSKYTLEQHIRSRCRGSHEVSRVPLENRRLPLRTRIYVHTIQRVPDDPLPGEKKRKKTIYNV